MNIQNLKRFAKNAAVCVAMIALPAIASADTDTSIFTEVASEIDKLETGIKAIGAAIVGVTVTGTSYVVAKRWIRRV